ncbi:MULTISPECIES: N-acetylglucosamine-6-phosphate deacetylase [unclassified Salinibacterium]|uniref:N-acetylglucosamine-6-phosphate deacetylase n=1 Tax=unclassified Salinibacterium TaxID=2632331 RepID=UPI0018CEBCF5|nr:MULTISPECIES: N-acetylglucosamine-6-phosphate deacetylase [unclassified Salinibacterium]MBH0053405.1 N-acetylglucosamine-6-phosphate deacetylase [Salinibacterium sp. SWN139]MBH0082663.1 N-acetylglucosamine-6-phosphate deacetylase [Salinibacterium sp. SWN167]
MFTRIIHSATLVSDGVQRDNAWVGFTGDSIGATGTGDSWREQADAATLVTDANGDFLTPGFIDIHCHGADGVSFDDGIDAITTALAAHRSHGTTRSVLSLISDGHERLVERLGEVAELTHRDPLVLGSHLEGPFIDQGFRGAHNPAALRTPTATEIEQLLTAADGTLRQITLAPELPGGAEAVAQFVAADVRVAIGHTAATYAETRSAFEAGASILTHAFNAMREIHHRAPGPVAAAFHSPGVTLEVINDGVHVHPDVVKMLFASAPGRIALVTDAMAATCAGDGHYLLGSLDVTVTDGVARLSDNGAIAGSTLTMDAAVRRAVTDVSLSLPQAVAAATAIPARAIGREGDLGSLAPGFAADAVLLDADLRVRAVWAAGRELPQPSRLAV